MEDYARYSTLPIPAHTVYQDVGLPIPVDEDEFREWDHGGVQVTQEDGKELALHDHQVPLPSEPEALLSPRPKRRASIILSIVVLALVVTGAVLGCVLGTRRTNSADSNNTSTSNTPPENVTSTTPPPGHSNSSADGGSSNNLPPPVELKSIRRNSALCATGWRSNGSVEILLFYQGPDVTMRFSKYDSGRGSFTTNGSYWEDPVDIWTPTAPANGTALAVESIVWGPGYLPQVEFFYINDTSRINGVNFNDIYNGFAPGLDSMNSNGVTVATGQSVHMAGYWPYTLLQLYSGKLAIVRNSLLQDQDLHPSGYWQQTTLEIEAIRGSGLALVPVSTNYTTVVQPWGYGIVYQGTDGRLVATVPVAAAANASVPVSWPASSAFPSISLPQGAAFAAFSTARSQKDLVDGPVNTFIVYQNASTLALNQVWTDDGATWQRSAPAALSTADNGTSIACITTPTTNRDVNGAPVYLEVADEMTRCYFQRGGAVVEVWLQETDWVELGLVPLA